MVVCYIRNYTGIILPYSLLLRTSKDKEAKEEVCSNFLRVRRRIAAWNMSVF